MSSRFKLVREVSGTVADSVEFDKPQAFFLAVKEAVRNILKHGFLSGTYTVIIDWEREAKP